MKILFSILFTFFFLFSRGQFLMDMIDTSTEMGKSMLSIYQKFDRVKISGYMQPQFQVAQKKGTKSFNGGDFPANVDNRFMLRRGRLRFDYLHISENKGPSVQFVFQFDGTERGVFIRDFWGRLFENKFKLFSITTGMFARPFSYELNLSSADRESPERGRMSQLLMKTERDMGVMISFDPRGRYNALQYFKIDAGFFNGPGLAAPADIDNYKDFIARISAKPLTIRKHVILTAAVSWLDGGLVQNTRYAFSISKMSGKNSYGIDSGENHVGHKLPRRYYGADLQLKIKNKVGFTELRGEFITGKQTATLASSETPPNLLTGSEAYVTRNFNGAYIYFLQHLFSLRHQLIIKYDWYDPQKDVTEKEIGSEGTNFTSTDIKFSTLGFGYIWYVKDNAKFVFWYEKVINEKTQLPGFTSDLKDNVFTCRLQFRF